MIRVNYIVIEVCTSDRCIVFYFDSTLCEVNIRPIELLKYPPVGVGISGLIILQLYCRMHFKKLPIGHHLLILRGKYIYFRVFPA